MFRHKTTRYNQPSYSQCHKCQELGHHMARCKNQRKCLKCAKDHHHRDCLAIQTNYVCANCQGNHTANDNRCPKIIEAKNAASDRRGQQNRPQRVATGNATVDAASNPQPLRQSFAAATSGSTSTEANAPPSSNVDVDISATIKTAVNEAVAEAVTANAQLLMDMMTNFTKEMAKTSENITLVTAKLAALVDRYVDNCMMAERNRPSTIFPGRNSDRTSTPLPTGHRLTPLNMEAARQMPPTAPTLME